MAKFKSRSGVTLETVVVSEAEAPLQARTALGNEQLEAGDALITVKGKSYALRAPVFEALFEADGKSEAKSEAKPEAAAGDDAKSAHAGKGGQHESKTKG